VTVRLRALTAADARAYWTAFEEDPELASMLGFDEVPEPVAMPNEWVIADAETDAFLGLITVHSWDAKNRRAETRFWIAPAARGRGALSRGLALVLDWCWAQGIERMELTALPENTVVPRIAEKFGYAFEGTLRQRNLERGRRVDILIWGLLAPTLR
jgi:RimJ/RimL family protein N-acetyltransferase